MANISYDQGFPEQATPQPVLRAERPQGAPRAPQEPYAHVAPHNPNLLKNIVNISAACLSVVLIGGVAIWGYNLMQRDVSGLPVVRAIEGDMRVLPEDPGGQLAQNQGLAVNSVVAHGASNDPAQTLKLAPEPIELQHDDLSISVAPSQQADLLDLDPNSSVAELLNELGMSENVQVAALNSGPKIVSAPKRKTVVDDTQATQVSAQNTQVFTAAVPKSVVQSLRPSMRPAQRSVVKTAAVAPLSVQAGEIDPASIPAGTRLVQVGAFDSPEIARQRWSSLEKQFGEFLYGKSRVVQQTQSNGRTFYRLRVMGFADATHARQFCSAFRAQKVDCIPVVVK